MAEGERSADDGSEPDLHARIRARIAERRAARAAEQELQATPVATGRAVADSVAEHPAAVDLAAGSPVAADPVAADPVAADPAGEVPVAPASAVRLPTSTRRPTSARRPPSRVSRLTRALGFLFAVAATVMVLRSFVIASYYIPSASMEPTLHGCQHCQPDLVVVDKLSYRFSSVARSDVVVFDRPPLAPPEDSELIKRVIGLPGETISGHDGRVFVGDKALTEPYVNPACGGTGDFAAVKVPAGDYFVMGDNRCDSLDSRVFGVILGSSIVGRSVAISWPVKHLRWL